MASPGFQLTEIASVSDDGYVARSDARGYREFSAEDWAKVYQAKGDFAVIGITLRKDQPVPNFEKYIKIMQRSARDPAVVPFLGTLPTELKFNIDPNLVQIRGVGTAYYPFGSLATVDLVEKPDVVVAIVFSQRVRIEAGPGPTGHKGDNARVSEPAGAWKIGHDRPIRIDWEYSTRTRKMLFNGKPYDLPYDRIAVVKMENGKPNIEVKTRTEAAVRDLRLQMGWQEDQQIAPSLPLPVP